jgi:hypothetical protein
MFIEKLKAIQKLKLRLLQEKKWRYLRYLHLHDCLKIIEQNIKNCLIIGGGKGIAELLLAIEFPHIHFYITDIYKKNNNQYSYPNYIGAIETSYKWNISNITFGILDIFEKYPQKYDFIATTEVLEHIKQASEAFANMEVHCLKYIYCLVPYANNNDNSDLIKLKKAWDNHEHYLVGYNLSNFKSLINPTFDILYNKRVYGVQSQNLRKEINTYEKDKISVEQKTLENIFQQDLSTNLIEGDGIKFLLKNKINIK